MPEITHAEAIARAKKVGEVCKRNAAEVEKLRRLPPENVAAMMESDLVGLIIPKERGGYGIDSWMAMCDVVAEVGRNCGASGWCFDLLIHHHWVLGMFPPEASDHVYKTDKRAKIGTSFMPTGRMTPAPGGFRVTGEWQYSSGIDHSDWAILGGMAPPPGGQGAPDIRFVLFGPGEFKVKDTWYAMGLKGSGSNNAVVNDVFVPEEHTIRMADFVSGRTPGSKVNKGVMFSEPGFTAFGFGIFCPMIAIARGALDAFREFQKNRSGGLGRNMNLALLNAQRAAGESAAEIDAAYLLAKDIDARLMARTALPADPVTRRNFTLASRLLVRAVDRLFELTGARGIMENSAVQRFWRDVHAAGHHVAWGIDDAYAETGAEVLGIPLLPGLGQHFG